eukprot:Tamp_09885.p3 GENE.Tamp_09885~~Tamp_09885.p3  ORF type:complete len:107 (+),score=12.17 Tamp_09885:1583-1903(+)
MRRAEGTTENKSDGFTYILHATTLHSAALRFCGIAALRLHHNGSFPSPPAKPPSRCVLAARAAACWQHVLLRAARPDAPNEFSLNAQLELRNNTLTPRPRPALTSQ